MSKWNVGQNVNTPTPQVNQQQVMNRFEDLSDLLGKFRSKIMQTKHLMANDDPTTDGWVETTQEVIDYLYPKGLGKSTQPPHGPLQHFIYDGVFCCLEGKKAEVQEQMEKSVHDFNNDPLPGKDLLQT